MRRRPSWLRRTIALLGAAWLLVAFVLTTVEALAMVCPEETTTVAAPALPPCHGHGPNQPTEKPKSAPKDCSPFCQLLCHGLALLSPPALAIPLVVVPELTIETSHRPLPLLPDTIDHVPL